MRHAAALSAFLLKGIERLVVRACVRMDKKQTDALDLDLAPLRRRGVSKLVKEQKD